MNTEDQYGLVLASSSPRRRRLLSESGFNFEVAIPDICEEPKYLELPEDIVQRLALQKVTSVKSNIGSRIIIGADSLVVLDGLVIGKPRTINEAWNILEKLRQREHYVVTGVSVVDIKNGYALTVNVKSKVLMRNYSYGQVEQYVASGLPMDKAGAYGVQDCQFDLVDSVNGCYTNVVGLPLCITIDLLVALGVSGVGRDQIPAKYGCGMCPNDVIPSVSRV